MFLSLSRYFFLNLTLRLELQIYYALTEFDHEGLRWQANNFLLYLKVFCFANIDPIGIPLGTCIRLLGPSIRSLAFTIYGIRITDLSVLYSK